MNPEPITLLMALTAGFLGSGHCLGMCGGIATLPAAASSKTGIRVLLFNLGRLVSYALLGALVGLLGASIGDLFDVRQWSMILRIATGVVVILVGIYLLTGIRALLFGEKLGARFWAKIAPLAKRFSSQKNLGQTWMLGMLWGYLPCGLVYSMLLAASVSGSPVTGAGVMVAFGLGTLPAMAGLGLAGSGLLVKLRQGQARRIAGVVLILGGLWTAGQPIYHQYQMQSGERHQHHMNH